MITIIDQFSPEFNEHTFHPLQSWQWGEARKTMGIEVLRIGEFNHEKLINVFQLTFHQLPLTSLKIGYLPRSKFPSNAVLEYLYQYGKKNKIIFIKIEPYIAASGSLRAERSNLINRDRFVANAPRDDIRFAKSPHPLFPDWTIILDITKSEDELLKNMHHKTRYNIKLAEKKGVVVKEMSNQKGFEIFSRLYFATCRRQKYFGHSKEYHQIIWDNLKNKIAHILVAFYKETPLSAYELFHYKDIVYYPYGGSSPEYRNYMAANLLMWESIKLAKKLGAEKFDMWGSLPPGYNKNHPWAGFTRFKEGYGGKFTQLIGSYDLVIKPVFYQLYTYSHFLRQLFLKTKRILS